MKNISTESLLSLTFLSFKNRLITTQTQSSREPQIVRWKWTLDQVSFKSLPVVITSINPKFKSMQPEPVNSHSPLLRRPRNESNSRGRLNLFRGMTVQSVFQSKSGQANRHFWAMCYPGNIFRFLDGSVIYRIWLPVVLHTLFAALIVTLYWIYDFSMNL